MPSTSSDRGWRARTATLLFAWTAGCTFVASPTHPRPPLAVRAPAVSARPVPAPDLREYHDRGTGRTSGVLGAGDESVTFHVLRQVDRPAPRPLVVLVPILAGGESLMESVATRMLDHGFDVAWCARAGSALKAPQRAPQLDELFRRTVLHQRLLLRWLREAEEPPTATFVLGMSMGGMVATVVSALEPDLDGIALCLSGGDLAGMVGDSSEARVASWIDWRRKTDGIGDDHLEWELQQFLRHEPVPFAAAIPAEKVLFVGARFDTVVPRRHQDLLWEALGRPARLQVPFGHYSSALAIDTILGAAAAHFADRLARRTAARPGS